MTKFTGSFMGLTMQQYWMDLYLWETFFNNYDVRTLVELGTGHGGMSLFLAMQSRQRGIDYLTLDNIRSIQPSDLTTLFELEARYHCTDIFGDGRGYVENYLKEKRHPAMIFFDNGNKPREWQLYAPLLVKGDFCAVHDWGTEFCQEHINGAPVELILEDVDLTRPKAMRTAWFVVK